MNRGVFMTPGREEEWTLSVVHSFEDCDAFVAAFEEMAADLDDAVEFEDGDRLGAALAVGATPPADWYADPAIQRLEGEHLRAHLAVRRPGRPRRGAGDFYVLRGQIPIVVVRDTEGVLRGS